MEAGEYIHLSLWNCQAEGQSGVDYLTCVLFREGKSGAPGGNPRRQGESMLTQHRKVQLSQMIPHILRTTTDVKIDAF